MIVAIEQGFLTGGALHVGAWKIHKVFTEAQRQALSKVNLEICQNHHLFKEVDLKKIIKKIYISFWKMWENDRYKKLIFKKFSHIKRSIFFFGINGTRLKNSNPWYKTCQNYTILHLLFRCSHHSKETWMFAEKWQSIDLLRWKTCNVLLAVQYWLRYASQTLIV